MEPASLLEEIRFGYGPRLRGARAPGGVDPDRVLAQLTAADPDGAAWDRPDLAARFALIVEDRALKKTGLGANAQTTQALKDIVTADQQSSFARPTFATAGFVERLVNLWANRITVSNASGNVPRFVQSFRDDAIRPHIGGNYGAMLKAALWHPAMQVYLSQNASIGPGSVQGKRRKRGLNENLAREFLELHSMRSGYGQEDVTQLAMLLAGMVHDEKGRRVDKGRVQPGKKQILGQTFDDSDPKAEIDRMVAYVALRPETAANVGHTLARHFIADQPPADLVDSLAAAYLAHGGDLPPVYRVLLAHPSAQGPDRPKLRSPQEYVAASLRLLGIAADDERFAKMLRRVPAALLAMGQPIYRALGPNGWPEVAQGWMTPPMMAARIDWAIDCARLAGDRVDPVAMVHTALGDLASPLLKQSATRAEQRWEGLAVLLGSPEFSRR